MSRAVSKTGSGTVEPESVWTSSVSVSNVSISLAHEQQVTVVNILFPPSSKYQNTKYFSNSIPSLGPSPKKQKAWFFGFRAVSFSDLTSLLKILRKYFTSLFVRLSNRQMFENFGIWDYTMNEQFWRVWFWRLFLKSIFLWIQNTFRFIIYHPLLVRDMLILQICQGLEFLKQSFNCF